jgi:hypothetical protein
MEKNAAKEAADMIQARKLIGAVFFCLFGLASAALAEFPVLRGPYLGQKPPGTDPEIFAPGIISRGGTEIFAVFSPDGREFFYTTPGPRGFLTVKTSRLERGQWTEPAVASFSGRFYDCAVGFSPDGKKLFFVSMRPARPGGNPSPVQNIWSVEKRGGAWGPPVLLPEPVNSAGRDLGASFTRDGTIYFNTTREGIEGGGCRSKFIDGTYSEPESLQELLGTDKIILEVAVDREARYMVFVSMEGEDGWGGMDLYVSFNRGSDEWTPPLNMGPGVNTPADENFPWLSADGRYLFFASNRKSRESLEREKATPGDLRRPEDRPGNGKPDLYWVGTERIAGLDTDR